METPKNLRLSRSRLRWLLSVVALATTLSAGCHDEYWVLDDEPVIVAKKPVASVSVAGARALPLWDKAVHFVPDTQHGGKPVPGIIGRIALLDLKGTGRGIVTDGELQIDFYDHSMVKKGGEPIRMPGCNYKPEHLAMFLKEDSFTGWGYTIFLPWPSYRPDVTDVYLEGRFIPTNGEPPIHITGTKLSLDHSAARDQGVWKTIRNETFTP